MAKKFKSKNVWYTGLVIVDDEVSLMCRIAERKKTSYCSFDCNITINPFLDSNIPLAINFFTSYIGNSRKYFDSARSDIYMIAQISCLASEHHPPPPPPEQNYGSAHVLGT